MAGFQADLLLPGPLWKPPTDFPNLIGNVGIDTETKDPLLKTQGAGWFPGGQGKLLGFSLAWHEDGIKSGYWPLQHASGNVDNEQALGWLQEQAKRTDIRWISHYSSYEIGWFKRYGIEFAREIDDTWMAAVLLDETRLSYSLDSLSKKELGEFKFNDHLAEGARALNMPLRDIKNNLDRLPAEYVGDYGEQDAVLALRLWEEKFLPALEADGLEEAYCRERAFREVWVDARCRGVRVNLDKAEQVKKKFKQQADDALKQVHDLSGYHVDPWNASSLAAAFEARGIKLGLTDAGQPSVTKEFLDACPDPMAKCIRTIRTVQKLSQFVDAGLKHVTNGRVHPFVNQLIVKDDEGDSAGAITTRLSYENPNLQQVPAKDEQAFEVREIYEPEEGEQWAVKDYSQQEPRFMVHFAVKAKARGALDFRQRYRDNPETDFYDTAVLLTGLDRKPAKTIGLGIPFGMGGGKLCRSLGKPTKWIRKEDGRWVDSTPGDGIEVAGPEGQDILNQFDEALPFVRELTNEAKKKASARGYLRTAGGGLARFPYRDGQRWFLHKAFNRLIQRSAAEQTKQAMIEMYEAGGDAGRILIAVHDEIDTSVAEPRQLKRGMEIMRDALNLEVPSQIDPELGNSWGSATKEKAQEWLARC